VPDSNLSRIYLLSEFNRKEARHQYLEAFKVSPEDRSIDDELEALFRDQDCEFDKTEMLIPARIVLGLILRPRGQGRGRARPEKEKWARRRADLAIRTASRRWAELVAEGISSKAAQDKAAAEVGLELKTKYKYSGLSLATLKARMRLSRGKKDANR
jgi:hypothetical protein